MRVLLTIFLVIATFTTCVAVAPSLSLTVSTPLAKTNADNLFIKVTVTNTGLETVKLLNDPSSVLSDWRTNSFSIKSNGGMPSFTGIRVKYSPELALKLGGESTFTVLAPGESFQMTHDLAGVYNFTSSGTGDYKTYLIKFSANNIFQYVDAKGQLGVVTADTQSSKFEMGGALVSFKHSDQHHARGITRRAFGYTYCSQASQAAIRAAVVSANAYVAESIGYLERLTRGTPRYTAWFGIITQARWQTVRTNFRNMWADASSTTYDCTCTRRDIYAYVYQNRPGYIYLCGAFWDAPNVGENSRAGTIVHEQSHFLINGGTRDHAYGHYAARGLGRSSPGGAVNNADSYEYFAENSPPLL
ncbi:Peptidyl-Lys metalloendopeptidase [Ceratobasidium theobromae]|uniref:Peptidyl-Lys metalloendopeptidase n=1 Tax=Ceratobasidium theobromae TaxID=1582974 RepID=A0A5N5R1C0_9AGAM|nr:Peptidyl-Lys metalloendopeptidase [Ceratobasidium theobromae]